MLRDRKFGERGARTLRKAISSFLFALLAMNTLVLTVRIQPAITDGTMIYTDAYGSAALPTGLTQSSTSVICTSNPGYVNFPDFCVAVVSGSNPTGTVSWSSNSSTGSFNPSNCTLLYGMCVTEYTDTCLGRVNITASYSGDLNNTLSSGSAILVIVNPPVFSVEPVAVAPLANINASINGLETPGHPPPVGQYFKVALHLRNATAIEVPLGVAGVELHFNFSSILPYVQVINYTDMFGLLGGVLNGNIIYGIDAGLYNSTGGKSDPPYTDAASYDVAAAGQGEPWNGADGLIAIIYFKIIGQPSVGQPDFYQELHVWNDYIVDITSYGIPHVDIQGTLHIDAQPVVHDIAVTDGTSLKTIVGQGYSSNVTITVANQGSFAEIFNVTVYANVTAIDTQQTSLNVTNQTILMFTWNTMNFDYGNYALTAFAWPVPGENITANNNFTLPNCLEVTIPGDINGDFKVSLSDLVLLANAYGSKPGDTKWNPNADINGNNIVDLSDLVLMAIHYGQHYP